MWGMQQDINHLFTEMRVTPTCVVNTSCYSPSQRPGRNHPHTCGEYHDQALEVFFRSESPPHVWGILKRSPYYGLLKFTNHHFSLTSFQF